MTTGLRRYTVQELTVAEFGCLEGFDVAVSGPGRILWAVPPSARIKVRGTAQLADIAVKNWAQAAPSVALDCSLYASGKSVVPAESTIGLEEHYVTACSLGCRILGKITETGSDTVRDRHTDRLLVAVSESSSSLL